MDHGALINEEWQRYLCELAAVRNICLVVSVDHIKAGIMWSEQMLDKFNFLAFEINTYDDYDIEMEYQTPLFSFKNDN